MCFAMDAKITDRTSTHSILCPTHLRVVFAFTTLACFIKVIVFGAWIHWYTWTYLYSQGCVHNVYSIHSVNAIKIIIQIIQHLLLHRLCTHFKTISIFQSQHCSPVDIDKQVLTYIISQCSLNVKCCLNVSCL